MRSTGRSSRIEQIPKAMQNAVISAENKTFRTTRASTRWASAAPLVNMAKGGETQGGSTITQQYVKNAHARRPVPDPEP